MGNEYKRIKLKLTGKQSQSIPVDIKKNGRYVTIPLKIFVRGFLKFDDRIISEESVNALQDKTVIYPVLFSSDEIETITGRCIITILPRSEDLLETTEQIQQSSNLISNSDIISEGGILSDEQLTDVEKEPVIIKIQPGVVRSPYKLSIEVTVTSIDGEDFYVQSVDRGINPQIEESNDITSLFQKEKNRIPSNVIIDCYSDSEWLPAVTAILGSNNSSHDILIENINKLKNSTPLGISTMYDSIISAARLLSDNTLDEKRKIIYLFTDNEANVSKSSVDNAITEINDIDGEKLSPVQIANMSVVQPETLSIKANSSDTRDINKLSFLTGGQSLTITSKEYLEEFSGIFYRECVGSMGYGTYEFVYDLGESALINNISATFDIPLENASATWKISVSIDGYNYTEINQNYSYSDSVDFEDVHAQYIKFYIVLISGISSSTDEYGTFPDTPSLLSLSIIYNAYNIAYLYLNKEDVDIQPYQMTLAVNANEINDDQIEVGVAKSDSHNWTDYQTGSQPSVAQNGKVVIPLRFSENVTKFQQEPLYKINMFCLKPQYGQWDPYASVILYDKNDDVIPSDYYRILPRKGFVVFNYALPSNYSDGDYKIGIINNPSYKIGLKMTNKTKDMTLELYGIGYLYTTGKDLLPPVAKSSPEVISIEITNEAPTRFDIISIIYTYYDSNFDPEDTSKRIIKWYINGNYISYLDNLITWNDLNNPKDPLYSKTGLTYPNLSDNQDIREWAVKQSHSILKAGDNIYCEIQVSDGSLYSRKVKSNIVSIIASDPVLDILTIKAKDENNNVTNRVATDKKAIIYPPIEQSFYSDGDDNQSEIIWFVNDEIFKRGTYGVSRGDGQPPIHEIWPNEVGTDIYKDYGLRITNTIFAQIVPKTANKTGEPVTTPVVVVQNALPRIYNVSYVNTVFSENRDVVLTWDFFDFEINAIGDIDETGQFDQTEIKWYRKNSGSNQEFELVYIYNDHDSNLQEVFNVEDYRGNITTNLGTHTSTISNYIIYTGQQWYAEIIPHDSIDYGPIVISKTITITSYIN